MRGLSRRAVTGRENRGGTLGGRGQGLAARTIVAVELAAGVDGDADGRLRSHRLEVVPALLGPPDDVARARVDGAGVVLDVLVALAGGQHPPPVAAVTARGGRVAGQVTGDGGLRLVGRQ